jgi:mannose-6-phosphate isomerase-like protein (cupin superfamily)
MSKYQAITLADKFAKFTEVYQPKVIARMNDYEFKLARVKGEFVWHSHDDTDETFFVIEGNLIIAFRDGEVALKAGDLFVVPRGVEHCPRAVKECKIMLIEPAGVVNTGAAGGTRTAPNDVWI